MPDTRDMRTELDRFLNITVEIDSTTVDVLLDYFNSNKKELAPSYTLHEHAVHEIYCIEVGTMTIECSGEIIKLDTGDICVIKAHTPHRIIECSEDVRRFNMRFMFRSGEYNEELLPPCTHYVPSENDAHEILHCTACIRNQQRRSEASKLEMYRLKAYYGIVFSYVLAQIESNDTAETLKRYNRLVLYVKIDDFFRVRCGEQVTIEALADHLSYSKAQTNRILHEYCGKPFSQILRDTRIRMAKQLLCETSLTVSEIASRCGYDTRQGFELMFSKHTGMTPHVFREINTSKKEQF